MAKMLSYAVDSRVCLSTGDVVQLVAETGAGDEVGAHVQRDGHQQVEGHLALVHRDQGLRLGIDAVDHEVGLERDVALREHPAEVLRGDRFGERALQRRHVGDLDLVAHAALGEERVGEEGELQRRDRALDRHLDDVHDEPAALPGRELVAQRGRAVEGVEVEDALAPLGPVMPGVWSGRGEVPDAMTR